MTLLLAPPPLHDDGLDELVDERATPVHGGTAFRRARQRVVKVITVGVSGIALVLGLCAAVVVTDVAAAKPAAAVTVGGEWTPPQIYLYFDREETLRVGRAANTGFTPFLGVFCGMIPGGSKLAVVRGACVVASSVRYGATSAAFKHAASMPGWCVRVSYPPAFPFPNPAPYTRAQRC